MANLGRWKMEAILRGARKKGKRLVLWAKWHLEVGYHIRGYYWYLKKTRLYWHI